ncbi:patatin [Flavobacterium ammoniigenes]|jgi:NTE family protein|uniref:Patatin n=1 Tax=Flavobacterium ammoniigenes TaxID=1751095 RepID=A0ABM7V3P7_9FLAO|nr:patatin-like phospholipase family protein [Flavobacterium ammoniigenes]BDB54145.1 patatin [Flavobacterium ammoniigenes]
MSLSQLSVASPLSQFFFSKEKKGAPAVALFPQEKIAFTPAALFTSIWGLLLVGVFLFSFQNSFAQEQKRPKIGLVLSGGGAKGFAHIGVLKVIEEAGVKIDYIGGTSMGAVVGGLYASGYNATQIDSIFHKVNFDELLNDYIPRSAKSFYEKRNDETYAITLPFSNFKVGIPQALSKGLYNFNLLSRLTRHVRQVNDFNQLPTPFLCIGTNIETGQQVVLNKGNLAQAMLASAAFPTLFTPIEIDGQLLIDGGVANNFPVDEVKNLGADLIIGVDVQDGLWDKAQLKNATKILVQITNLHSIEQMKNKIKGTDIYITPDIKNFGVLSFDRGREIIQRGEEAAFAAYEKIKILTDDNNYFKKPKLSVLKDSLKLAQINTTKLSKFTTDYVFGKLGFKPNTPITYGHLESGINTLLATENFHSISYSFKNNERGEALELQLSENPIYTYLKLGLHYDELFKSAILVNITHKNTLFKNDLASLDIILGDNFRYNLDYYVDNGFNFSYGFKSQLSQFNRNITQEITKSILDTGVNQINVDYLDLSTRTYVQKGIAQRFLFGAGVELKYLHISSKTIANPIIDKSSYWSGFGYVKYDSFDNKYFPKKGWSFTSDFQSYLFASDYHNDFKPFSIVKAEFSKAFSLSKAITFKFQGDVGLPIGNDGIPFFNFVLGGYGYNSLNNFKPFFGYDFLSIAANSFIKASGTIDFVFLNKNHLNFSANFANLEQNLFKSKDWISLPNYSGYALGYGLETRIGPIEVKYSWSPELTKGYTWFGVGFWF